MITIVMMTWKEMLRKKVMTLSLVMTAVFLVAFWFVAHAIGKDSFNGTAGMDPDSITALLRRFQQGAMTLSLGFFFGSFVIAFLSIFSSVAVIAGEAEQGVMQALLPRPLARWRWFLGRWLGYVSLGVIYAALLFGFILAITQINSTVPGDFASLTKSFVLFAFAVPLLVSVSMLGSCFFSALGNGVFMVMLFGAGWLGGMIEKVSSIGMVSEDTLKPLQTISGLMSIVMPVDSLQRRMLAEMFSLNDLQGLTDPNSFMGFFGLNQTPSNTFLIYTACYTLLALWLGIVIFRRKDL
jgi:ABC-type transport system involved in multi-copper enzyme maturation permease subunit